MSIEKTIKSKVTTSMIECALEHEISYIIDKIMNDLKNDIHDKILELYQKKWIGLVDTQIQELIYTNLPKWLHDDLTESSHHYEVKQKISNMIENFKPAADLTEIFKNEIKLRTEEILSQMTEATIEKLIRTKIENYLCVVELLNKRIEENKEFLQRQIYDLNNKVDMVLHR